jgi:hypothetical protein
LKNVLFHPLDILEEVATIVIVARELLYFLGDFDK